MKFSLDPPPGQSAFDQWKDAMKAVNRLPMGIPPEFRKKVWLSLADHYIRKLKIDWHKTVRLAFNERSNPDDDKLGMQIVKDLHRTGCSSFSGQDNEQDRAVLKRVLLAYARWNKRIGYCQGFNVIAALLLNVMERKEDDALKVMIYLIDHVLPESYFANNLRALSVDMAVFRDLLRLTLPTLSKHLDRLQHAAQDVSTGACYEPPLTNVFTMQWFLTVFATCLPKEVVLRVWDAILLEGSEVLLRTALCLWGKLARRIMQVDSADEFYTLMGELSSDMMEGTIFNSDDMIKAIYTIAPFPFPQLTELREKYTYNIRPFSSTPAPGRKASRMAKAVLYSDEDELDEEELRAITSFPGMSPVQGCKGKGVDISLVGPGAYGAESELVAGIKDPVLMERMTTDITALKMQYDKLRQRQRQAHVIFAAASAKKAVQTKQKAQASVLVPKIESPHAMNHLFIGKVQGGRNRLVTTGPRIAATTASSNNTLTKQLEAVAAAQAVSRSKRLPIKDCTSDTGNLSRPQKQESKESLQSFNRLPESSESCEHEKLCQQTTAHNENDSSTIIQSSQSNVYSLDGDAKQHHGSEKGIRQNSPITTRDESAIQESFIQLMTISDKLAYSDVEEDDGNHSLGEEITDNLKLQEEADFNAFGRLDSNAKFCQQGFESFDSKEGDSGIVLSSPSPNASVEPSPEKKALKSFSTQLQDSLSVGDDPTGCSWQSGWEQGDLSPRHKNLIGRCLSAPSDTTVKTVLTPTHKQPSISIPSTPTDFKMLCSPSHQLPLSSSVTKTNRPFNPFPVKHVNKNRAKTGLKLGLYTPSQLEHIQEQLRGGLSGKKPRNASS